MSFSRTSRAALLGFGVALGCAGTGRVLPSGGGGWREVSSAHFAVRTDLSSADARAASAYLEQSRAALIAVFGPRADRPQASPTEVTVFADGLEFEHYFSRRVLGLYTRSEYPERIVLWGPPSRWEQRSTLAVEGHSSVLKHEMTHALAAGVYIRQPRWFNEGMAQFLETFELSPDGRSATFGMANLKALRFYNQNRSVSLADAFAWDHVALDAQSDGEFSGHYGLSWALTHWFFNTHLKEFSVLQEGYAKGRSPELAWKAAMGGARLEDLDVTLNQYVKHGDYQVFVLPVAASGGVVRERMLTPAQVATLHGEMALVGLSLTGEHQDSKRAEAKADFAQVLAVDPADVGALSLQKYSSPQERFQAAQRAVATHPDDAGAWRLLALALKAGPEEMEAMRHALALEPNDPLMLNNLAWAESQTGQVAAALEKAERAVNFVPWSFSYVDTLAVVLMKSHRCAEALVTAQRAVDLLPENLPAASRAQFEGGVERIRTGCHPTP